MPVARRLSALLAVEGVGLALIGIAYGIASLSDKSRRAPAELAAAGAVLIGVFLLVLARSVAAERPWSRTPSVVLNVFPLPIGIGLLQAGDWWAAVPLMGLAGTVLYLFATPEMRETFRER